jgi:SAM-dependent methyltransferase
LRATAAELLRVRIGDRLLDAGSGTGEVVRSLAALVGPYGKVIGVEPSTTMLDVARRRTGDAPRQVEFRGGDITALDFADATFDGATCERVFQHLDAPEVAICELARVTRPGGRVVVIDTDWGMHAVHGADPGLTARITSCWSDITPNGRAGRQLPAMFTRAGITDPAVVAETITSTDPMRPTMAPLTTMADAAARAGAITREDAESWLRELAHAGISGDFFWAVTMFAVGGARR